MIVLLLALATFDPSAHLPMDDVIGPNANKIAGEYWTCVVQSSDQLASSREGAGDVVDAAIADCVSHANDLMGEITLQMIVKEKIGRKGANAEQADRIFERFDDRLRNAALLRFIEKKIEKTNAPNN
jgi:hypothetical protein